MIDFTAVVVGGLIRRPTTLVVGIIIEAVFEAENFFTGRGGEKRETVS